MFLDLSVKLTCVCVFLDLGWRVTSVSVCLSESDVCVFLDLRVTCVCVCIFVDLGWSVKSNDRAYHQLPEFQRKVFLCIKKSKYSVSLLLKHPAAVSVLQDVMDGWDILRFDDQTKSIISVEADPVPLVYSLECSPAISNASFFCEREPSYSKHRLVFPVRSKSELDRREQRQVIEIWRQSPCHLRTHTDPRPPSTPGVFGQTGFRFQSSAKNKC